MPLRKYLLSIIFLYFFISGFESNSQRNKNIDFFPISLNLEIDVNRISSLDSLTLNRRFFFFGESHGVPINQSIHFEIFKYLHQNRGVRNYVMEGNYSYVYFINKYVQTGNKDYLRVVQNNKNSEDNSIKNLDNSFSNLYESIFLYNQGLPKKIKLN